MHPINQELVDADLLCGQVDVPEVEGYYAPDPAGGYWDVSEPDEFFAALRWMIESGVTRTVLRGTSARGTEWVLYSDGDVVCE